MTRLVRAALVALLSLASCTGEPALAQNLQPSGLPARGAVQGTDVIVDQPAGSSTVKGALASALATYVQGALNPISALTGDCAATGPGAVAITCTKSNGTAFGTFAFQSFASLPSASGAPPISASTVFPCVPSSALNGCTGAQVAAYARHSIDTLGADPTGTNDSTSAIQSALTSGGWWTCNGIYKVSATLNLTAATSEGATLDGGAPQAQSNYGASNRCILKPTSAVSTVFNIDGTGFSGYQQGVSLRNFAVDLANSTSATVFAQGQSFDINYYNVRVLNGALGECSWKFNPGALVTQIANSYGVNACWNGNGSNNPTTQTFVNSDLVSLSGSQAGSIVLLGGAVQPQYYSGMPVIYSAPGDLNRPTAVTQTGGLYFYEAITLTNVDSVNFDGAFIGQNGGYPSTYSDGTHGTLSIYPAMVVGATWTRVTVDPAHLDGMYLYDGGTSTNAFQTNVGGGAPGNVIGAQTAFKNGVNTVSGSNITTYSDNGYSVTSQVNGATGAASYPSLTLKPATNATALLVETAAGAYVLQCVTYGTPNCDLQNGAGLYGFSDTGVTQLWALFKGYANGGEMQLLNASGAVQLSLYGGSGAISGTGNASFAGYYTGATAGVTCSGTPTSSFATSGGIVTHC
jgi:hypothetical protein